MARHEHKEAEMSQSEFIERADEALAAYDNTFIVGVQGIAVPTVPEFGPDYDFPVENRERDLRVLNYARRMLSSAVCSSDLDPKRGKGKDWPAEKQAEYAALYMNRGGTMSDGTVVAAYEFSDSLGDQMSLLETAIDMVRWDRLVATGEFSGAYADHKTTAEVRARNEVAKENPLIGKSGQPIGGRTLIRENLDAVASWAPGAPTYGVLVGTKVQEILGSRVPKRTRKPAAVAPKTVGL